jgi:hypothetical protein
VGVTEVHEDLHERREKLQQPPQLLLGLIRPRGSPGLALHGAHVVPTAAEGERAGPRGEEARGGAAGAGEKVGREDGEAEAERQRRRHGAAAGGTRVEGNELRVSGGRASRRKRDEIWCVSLKSDRRCDGLRDGLRSRPQGNYIVVDR